MSDSSCASSAFCDVTLVSRVTTVPAPRVRRSSARTESRLAWAICAWSLRICASIMASCALSVRLSNSNSRSPSLTSAPSSTLTFMIWLSMRDLSGIDEIACTVPTASTMIGIDFGVTVITTTGTGPAAGRPGRRPAGCELSAALAGAKPSLRSISVR